MKNIKTHRKASERYVGKPVEVKDGLAVVDLETIEEMSVDDKGLVHGGFVFGLADLSAMLAVNEETVVLGSSEVKFTKPVEVGDELRAEGEIVEKDGSKATVESKVKNKEKGEVVLEGTFECYVLDKHVLED